MSRTDIFLNSYFSFNKLMYLVIFGIYYINLWLYVAKE